MATLLEPLTRRPWTATTRLSDEALAKRVREGDESAFDVLYDRHGAAISRYLLARLRDPQDVQDALQEAMAAALRALRDGTGVISVRAWLFRIAHNEALRIIKGRRDTDVDIDDVALAAPEADPDVSRRITQLFADIGQLPDQQRSALLLREVRGLGYGEIAEVIGTSETAARQAIFKARTALAGAQEGRDAACADVAALISDGDGRALRGRKVRAHLRDCTACSALQSSIRERSAAILLLPVFGLPAGAGLASGLQGAGVAAASTGTASASGTALGGASFGGIALTAGVAKGLAAFVIAAGGGATAVATAGGSDDPAPAASTATTTTTTPTTSTQSRTPPASVPASLRTTTQKSAADEDDAADEARERRREAQERAEDARKSRSAASARGREAVESTPAATRRSSGTKKRPSSTPAKRPSTTPSTPSRPASTPVERPAPTTSAPASKPTPAPAPAPTPAPAPAPAPEPAAVAPAAPAGGGPGGRP